MSLAQSSILITGAAKRVGAAIAKELARQKPRHLVLHYRHSKKEAEVLAREVKKLGAKKVSLVQADLSLIPNCKRLVHRVTTLAPDLNAVVFNASLYQKTPFGSVTEAEWDNHFAANLKSVFFMAQDLSKTLKANGPSKIVLMGDWAGLRPYTQYIPYCLSKSGILYMTHALAKAMAPEVQVNAVLPGPVLLPEDMSAEEKEQVRHATLLKRLGTPDAVASAVRFFIEEANFSTGSWLNVDGGRGIA